MNAMAEIARAEMARWRAEYADDEAPEAFKTCARKGPNGYTANRVAARWLNGWKAREIAEDLDISLAAVFAHRCNLGLPRRKGPGAKKKYAAYERDIARLWAEGKRIKDIAAELGLTHSAVQHVKAYLQLPNRKPRRKGTR